MCIQNNEGEFGDDDEWGDLIATPNRLIADEFFVLKDEYIDEKFRVDEKSGGDDKVRVSDPSDTGWSQMLTIPPGISSASLLDPMTMIPNSQESSATGTFMLPPMNHESFGMNSAFDDSSCDSNSFTYQQPNEGSLLWSCISELQNQPQVPSGIPMELSKETITKHSATALHSHANKRKFPIIQPKDENDPKRRPSDGYPKETSLPPMRNSEDGYNWRKYGQKQVKGSEYPRSYYKCTHPNCQVKKKVERSHDGHITEIIYKGAHNHQGQHNTNIGSNDANGSYIKYEDGELWENVQQGGNNNFSNCRTQDGIDMSSLTSVAIDNHDPMSSTQGKSTGVIGNVERNGNYNASDADGTRVDEGDEDKSDLKRRKKGNFLMETSLVTRAMREPRVVVQIESEVDILDDGYRWRKYGQKVVKGNPNPRSYYKCTTTGCPVRKHVERASDDLKSVLTTYEGKHNHAIPAARNSNHANTDVGSTSNPPNSLRLPKITNVPKPEPQVQDHPLIPSNFLTGPTKYGHYQNMLLPDFPISLQMPPPNANIMNGFGYNNNGNNGNNGRFIKPKMEHDDGYYDTFMHAPDHVTDASSRFCHVIPNFQS
ncbi:DNA-binding WRKY [Artemisia annua]|uniref:DNA-binding WRKY n=1 Tax=Artemisia annua TaxID=35608 RepID=A0A2U1M036_ARTAN|nr:DNA-binding WRKY [Artemisia annua]